MLIVEYSNNIVVFVICIVEYVNSIVVCLILFCSSFNLHCRI